jgi:hypothetical protein
MARLEKTIQKSNTIRTKNGTLHSARKIQVFFYRSSLGNEPVRVWLKSLGLEERKTDLQLSIKRLKSLQKD